MSASTRSRVLQSIGFRTYKAYLASPLWLSIRLRVFAVKGRRCCLCGRRAIQVHHRRYDRRTLLGLILTWLEPVCRKCHREIEIKPNGRKRTHRSADRHFKILKRKKAGPS